MLVILVFVLVTWQTLPAIRPSTGQVSQCKATSNQKCCKHSTADIRFQQVKGPQKLNVETRVVSPIFWVLKIIDADKLCKHYTRNHIASVNAFCVQFIVCVGIEWTMHASTWLWRSLCFMVGIRGLAVISSIFMRLLGLRQAINPSRRAVWCSRNSDGFVSSIEEAHELCHTYGCFIPATHVHAHTQLPETTCQNGLQTIPAVKRTAAIAQLELGCTGSDCFTQMLHNHIINAFQFLVEWNTITCRGMLIFSEQSDCHLGRHLPRIPLSWP